ncbi:hypothetical protein [Streptomyces sp. NPDC059247]
MRIPVPLTHPGPGWLQTVAHTHNLALALDLAAGSGTPQTQS